MSDLITWLCATLDAREREVRERHRQTCGHDEVGPDWPCNCDDHVSFSLAEVDAKRRILELHGPYEDFGDCSTCGDVPQVPYPCDTLRLSALPYAGWPGYREDWRP